MVVMVLSELRVLRTSNDVRSLSQRHDAERLRLALAGARAVTFDWTIADDRIVWDGATEFFACIPTPIACAAAKCSAPGWARQAASNWRSVHRSDASQKDSAFEIEFEARLRDGRRCGSKCAACALPTPTAAPSG